MGYSSEQELVGALIDAYYDKRDVEATLACVTEDIKWVGTEKNDSADGKAELRALLEADVAAFSDPFQIEPEKLVEQHVTDEVTLIWLTAHQVEVPGVVCGFTVRGTATCVNTEAGWLVANIHVSVPNTEMEKYSLQHELDETRKKEQTLMNGIPGGTAIYRMKKDGRVAVDYISEGLARLCGFGSVSECMSLIQDDAKHGIPAKDWNRIYTSILRSVEQGRPIRESYNIYSKDMKKVEITMDANVLSSGDLGEDDIAVLYAVHTLVSEESKKAEQERNRYRVVLGMLDLAYWEWSAENGSFSTEKYNQYAISEWSSKTVKSVDGYMSCVHPDDVEAARKYMRVDHPGQINRTAILRAKMKDGSYRWTEVFALVDIGAEGAPTRIITVMRDVDEEWQRQKKQLEFDELTGVYNRRYVENHLPAYINRAREKNENLGLAMVDVDYFKGVNDTYGHLAGDMGLKMVSGLLAGSFAIHKGDFVARFGGDEFMVVCQNIPKDIFEQRLRDVVQKVKQIKIEQYPGMVVGISVGCACTEDLTVFTEQELVKRADRFLYRAKEAGKGKVVSG